MIGKAPDAERMIRHAICATLVAHRLNGFLRLRLGRSLALPIALRDGYLISIV